MSLQTSLDELKLERAKLALEVEKYDFGIAAIEELLEDEAPKPVRRKKPVTRRRQKARVVRKPRARRGRPPKAKGPAATAPAKTELEPKRFLAVCTEHNKAVIVRDGDGWKCTLGHPVTAAVVRDTKTGDLYDYPTIEKALKGAQNKNTWRKD